MHIYCAFQNIFRYIHIKFHYFPNFSNAHEIYIKNWTNKPLHIYIVHNYGNATWKLYYLGLKNVCGGMCEYVWGLYVCGPWGCMWVSVCMWVCVCECVYVSVCMWVCVWWCKWLCMWLCVCDGVSECVCEIVSVYVSVYVSVWVIGYCWFFDARLDSLVDIQNATTICSDMWYEAYV